MNGNEKVGQRLKDLRKMYGFTQTELAEKLGIAQTTIFRYESGEIANMKTSTIKKLADIFHVSPLYILGLDEDNDIDYVNSIKKIPILGTICAGNGEWADEDLEGYFYIDTSIKNADFVVKVNGDSMIGDNIRNGDKVFVKRTNYVDNGKIAAVLLRENNEVTLKRVYANEHGVLLQPSNPEYEPIITDDYIILGEVVGAYHNY